MPSIKEQHKEAKAKVAKARAATAAAAQQVVSDLPVDMQCLVLKHAGIPRFGVVPRRLF